MIMILENVQYRRKCMAYDARRWIGTCLDDKKDMDVTLFRNDVSPRFVQYNSNELKQRDRSHGKLMPRAFCFDDT